MNKHNQTGFTHIILIIVVFVVLGAAFAGIVADSKREKGQKGNNTTQSNGTNTKKSAKNSSDMKFAVYPDTSDAPKLHLYWGEQKTTTIDAASLIEIERFGVFEDMPMPNCPSTKDPGAEWAMHFKKGSLPVYAYAPGTITNIQDEGASKEVVVRYGRQYAVKYLHVTNVPSSLKQGDKIEPGTLVGYTQYLEGNPGYEFWELEIDKIVNGTNARTDFPLTYFDDESKAAFEALRATTSMKSWFVDESSKDAGWLAYVGKPETWADPSKLGIASMGDDYCQFLRDNGLL